MCVRVVKEVALRAMTARFMGSNPITPTIFFFVLVLDTSHQNGNVCMSKKTKIHKTKIGAQKFVCLSAARLVRTHSIQCRAHNRLVVRNDLWDLTALLPKPQQTQKQKQRWTTTPMPNTRRNQRL